MCKKLFCTIVVLLILIIFSIPAMAHPTESGIDDEVSSGNYLRQGLKKQPLSGAPLKNDEEKIEDDDPFEKLLREIIEDKEIKETEQFLVGITENNNSSNFNITGCLKEKGNNDIAVILARYNKEKDCYEEYSDNYDESRWDIGASGVFIQAVELKKGENKLKLIIYKKTAAASTNIDNKQEITLELGKNLQITYLTVNVLDQNTRYKLINSTTKEPEIFNNGINKKSPLK